MFDSILTAIDDFVWGIPTIVLILATGILLTVRLRGVQFRKLGMGFRTMFKKTGGEGDVTPFQALCTALSATIGTGNIVGVATAIAGGGPGALLWMWVAALVGTATKYAECMLALKYRERSPSGHILGGPFYTIEKGLKEKTGFSWKWLAVLFAVFGVCVGLFGIGTFTQINGITSAVGNAFDPENKNVALAFGVPSEESLALYLDEHPEYQQKIDDLKARREEFAVKTDRKIEALNAELSVLSLEAGQNQGKIEKIAEKISALEADKANPAKYGKNMLVFGSDYHDGLFVEGASNVCTWAVVIGGLIVTLGVALVVIGGLKRISKVAEKVVPAMAVIYVFLGVSVLIMNASHIPAAFAVIFKSAFGWNAAMGGIMGWTFKQVTDSMQKGVARGIFSNEAGLGSAPIAAAAAQTDEPVEQGIVSMLGTFIDTIIICTMTGLAIVIAFYTGSDANPDHGLTGIALTTAAFNKVLGGDGRSVQFLLMICLVFFAFTTILGWDYYSERCLEYLSGGNMKVVKVFRVLYIFAVLIGPYFTISQVWTIADINNGLMAIPNCISLIMLSGVAAKETKKYFDSKKELKA